MNQYTSLGSSLTATAARTIGENAAFMPGRPASQLETQIAGLKNDAERLYGVAEELEQRLRLVLRGS